MQSLLYFVVVPMQFPWDSSVFYKKRCVSMIILRFFYAISIGSYGIPVELLWDFYGMGCL